MNPNNENPEVVEQETPVQEQAESQNEPRPETEDAQTEEVQTEGTIEEWKAALELAVKQRDEYLDSLRRVQADFQNFKRRNSTARSDGYEEGAREVVAAMLPVIDNLERAIDAAVKSGDEGSPMLESAGRFGLAEIPAEGCEFDPEVHNAVMREQTGEPGKVIEVFQKGYKVKERVIRYAMVKVSVE